MEFEGHRLEYNTLTISSVRIQQMFIYFIYRIKFECVDYANATLIFRSISKVCILLICLSRFSAQLNSCWFLSLMYTFISNFSYRIDRYILHQLQYNQLVRDFNLLDCEIKVRKTHANNMNKYYFSIGSAFDFTLFADLYRYIIHISDFRNPDYYYR